MQQRVQTTQNTLIESIFCFAQPDQVTLSFIFLPKISPLTSKFNIFQTTEKNYNMTAALDKLICTNFVEFGKKEDRFVRFSWFQLERYDNKYLENQLKVLRRDDKAEVCKHQQINSTESDFKQLLELRNPIVVATADFSGEKSHNLS